MASLDVEYVLSQLDLDEKVSLLSGKDFWHTKDIPRLGIPSLRLSDGPNGVRGTRFFNGAPASCLPCGTALASTWDKKLIQAAGELIGREAIAKGAHVWLGPTVNIQRSPLGGRGFESYSEDPYLSGAMAAAIVNGVQSTGVSAAIKHYVCNDSEHERQAVNCVVSERALREIYLLPFQIAQRDAQPASYMTSYNRVNGVHVSENKRLLDEVLRKEWGFDGFIMSDWFGTYSAAESTNSGLDLEMPGPPRVRGPNITVSLGNRKVAEHVLDERVRNLLNLCNRASKLGIASDAPEGTVDDIETRKMMRKVAAESIVLLKNDNKILPLDVSDTIAVMGPNTKIAAFAGGGSASLDASYTTTPLEGISGYQASIWTQGAIGYKQLPLLSGVSVTASGKSGMTAKFYNEPPNAAERVARDEIYCKRSDMLLVDYRHPDISPELFYMDLEGTFTPQTSGEYEFGCSVRGTATVYVDGELVVDNATKQRQGATFMGAGTLEERGSKMLQAGQSYSVLVQFGSSLTQKIKKKGATAMRGGGLRVGVALKTDPQKELDDAVDLAKKVKSVVICAGLSGEWESEGFDRSDMSLPGYTDRLIQAVSAVNQNTIVVLQTGTPVAMPWIDSVAAVVQAWYGGNEAGNGIADVLFGTVTPSAKLSLSFPVRNEDNPAYLNFRSEKGRCLYGEDVYVGYRFYEKTKKEVLFPFGHGLSYTTFDISDLEVKVDKNTLHVAVTVRNSGGSDGAEVVQVYVSQVDCPVTRPLKELKGFEKIFLTTGEEKRVKVEIELKYAASYWDEERDSWAMEKGDYNVSVGNSSANTPLQSQFSVSSSKWWRGI
ncbi:beta-glucosidase [Corynespora cassiicola Philippines]|uniref:beta-glucosidase n=1 Tax=Corynespora cassiicola Philippines TaxID=1448308 RepID=A0A2T2NYF2_CORCC|nr:beta-glucosidase [Corynespora cassiicola Philippines]